MKGIGYFWKPVKKKPLLLIIFGILTFICCYIEYSFIMPIVFGMSVIKIGNVLDSIMHLVQMVLGGISGISPMAIGFVSLGLLVVSLVAGLILSGTLNVLNGTTSDDNGANAGFAKGIRKHWLKLWRIVFLTIIYFVLFVIFVVVVTVPTIVITNASIEKPELLSVTYLLEAITALILFFGIMFFRIYILFWYPAAINYDKTLFARGKRAADDSFWGIVLRFIVFDILLIAFQLLMFYLSNIFSADASVLNEVLSVVVLLFVNWIFKTIMSITVVSFVFSKFNVYCKTKHDDDDDD